MVLHYFVRVCMQRLHQEINADYEMASSANIRDLFTLVRQKEFAKMLQKTQKPVSIWFTANSKA